MIETATPPRPSSPPAELASPAASRLGRARWRDARLVIGLLLVLGSVAIGARVVAAADETTLVLVATDDLEPGMIVGTSDLREQAVRIVSGLGRYVAAESSLDGYVVLRPVGAGELIPAAAVAATDAGETKDLRYLTMAIPSHERPAGLGRGTHVDVWVDADDGVGTAEEPRVAEQLLADVVVTEYDQGGGGLAGPADTVSVTLAVKPQGADTDDVIAQLITAARAEQVFLTVVPQDSAR